MPTRVRWVVVWTLWAACGCAAAQAPDPAPRPRIGLVLSGGGARGLAHVGVLKVLERERVPIDVIAGTSMGAIIGGLYASGMHARELERALLEVNWDDVFASRVGRQELSQRRKEEDFEISPVLELGLRDGVLRTPQAAVSSRGLEALLRRYTLHARSVQDFDLLPIPFRAVATDMESGEAVELERGDLALALRSSMSVPGVFSPTELDGRMLGDGGLVNNVPIDVARRMGADIVIVVNIGTPLAPRDTLGSVVGVTAQMINILTEQNVRRSLATMTPRDVLLSPQLGTLTAGDFGRAQELIALGEQGAHAAASRLAGLSLDAGAYAAWRAARPPVEQPHVVLDFIQFEGSSVTRPKRFAAQLESKVGEPFDPTKAERDARQLAATGDYVRADYQLVTTPDGDGLVFEIEDKPWGPHYFRVGLDLYTDFDGRSAFNIKVSHNRHWLSRHGTEWRNRFQIGEEPAWSTELYHPLNWTLAAANDWFAAVYAGMRRRPVRLYETDDGAEVAEFRRTSASFGVDLGQPWGRFGELRTGLAWRGVRTKPYLLSERYQGSREATRIEDVGLRLRGVIDQLDYAIFPQRGYRIEAEAMAGQSAGEVHGRFRRFEGQGTLVGSYGRHTFNLHTQLLLANHLHNVTIGRYTLGGFQHLSGYQPGQLVGNYVLFSRLTWYMRLSQSPTLTRGFFFGASAEAGNAWLTRDEIDASQLRTGMSVFIGADTGIGPLYLGVTHAPRGGTGLVLFIGRP